MFLVIMSGINDRRFSSRPTQALNHEEDETERMVPDNNVEKNNKLGKEK